MAELTAIGLGPQDRWQKPLPEVELVRLARAPRQGLRVPWDLLISREHAELTFSNSKLLVKCLETARNPIYFNDAPAKEFMVESGGSFRIGETQFVFSVPVERSAEIEMVEEHAFAMQDLEQFPFADPVRQLDLTAQLPELIATSKDDEDFAHKLACLLLDALPRVQVAAVVYYADQASIESGMPTMMQWDSRVQFSDRFRPSRKMIASALRQSKSLLHIWTVAGAFDPKFTKPADLDWAICTPIVNEACRGWCLYLSGVSTENISGEDLKGDLKFVGMMAQFIGAVRQVRQLEKTQANMSQFFNANVLETLTTESADVLLKPRESDITVIFCDVRGFSKMTEGQNSDLFSMLNRVIEALSVMTRGIVKYDGVISDFQGDAAMGFWGWPVALVDGPLPACQAALAIQHWFKEAAVTPNHPLTDFYVGIGVAHGRAIAGRIGSTEQAKIGVFGPPVNLGSRLESLTKQWRVPILIDEATADYVRGSMSLSEGRTRRLGRVLPAGLTTPLMISQLLPPASQYSSMSDQQIREFEVAVDAVISGNWPQAITILHSFQDSDGPRNFLLSFMAEHGNHPPVGWNGVIALTQK